MGYSMRTVVLGRSRSGDAPLPSPWRSHRRFVTAAMIALVVVTAAVATTSAAGPPVREGRAGDATGAAVDLLPSSSLAATADGTPQIGPAPLSVDFTLTVTGGTGPYRYSWSFGDGNESTLPAPSHTFVAPGNYTALATVQDADDAVVTESVAVVVLGAPLAASLNVSLGNGSAAGSATLTARLTGGEAPFVFDWSFGDGASSIGTAPQVDHAYAKAGTYSASVRVTDGAGDGASGEARVIVPGPVGASSPCQALGGPCGPLGASLSEWEIGIALLGAAVLLAAATLLPRRSRTAPRATGGPESLGPRSGDLDRDGAATDGLLVPEARGVGEPTRLGPARSGTPAGATEPSLRPLSERILLHLYRQGVPDPNRAVPASFTQDGMSVALGRPQGAFARALIRLEEAGLIRSEIAHVEGRARRAKTYRLTPQGESAARRLGAGATSPAR